MRGAAASEGFDEDGNFKFSGKDFWEEAGAQEKARDD